MAKSVKGNRKGSTRSYQFQRFLLIGSITLLWLVFCTVFFTGFGSTTSGNNVRRKTMFSDAAEVQVSAGGNVVEEAVENAHEKSNDAISLHKRPVLKYGTAWKKERTADYVYNAVMAGFRHIDTACQPKHYKEPLVGQGWTKAAAELQLDRSQIWLQTKFTSVDGQDRNDIPYDPTLPLDEQVRVSLKTSLQNLQTPYLDSWVMHGPEDTWEKNLLVWKTMEEFVENGVVRQIGISNFYDVDAIEYLYKQAKIKPAVVQNRFYSDSGYDVAIRRFCLEHNIEYQSFWTLGANSHAFRTPAWKQVARSKGLTPQTLMYAFCMSIGITPLDGTTSQEHLKEDVELVLRMQSGEETILNQDEVELLSNLLEIPEEGEEEEEEEEEEA